MQPAHHLQLSQEMSIKMKMWRSSEQDEWAPLPHVYESNEKKMFQGYMSSSVI